MREEAKAGFVHRSSGSVLPMVDEHRGHTCRLGPSGGFGQWTRAAGCHALSLRIAGSFGYCSSRRGVARARPSLRLGRGRHLAGAVVRWLAWVCNPPMGERILAGPSFMPDVELETRDRAAVSRGGRLQRTRSSPPCSMQGNCDCSEPSGETQSTDETNRPLRRLWPLPTGTPKPPWLVAAVSFSLQPSLTARRTDMPTDISPPRDPLYPHRRHHRECMPPPIPGPYVRR